MSSLGSGTVEISEGKRIECVTKEQAQVLKYVAEIVDEMSEDVSDNCHELEKIA